MLIKCSKCGKMYDYEKYSGICPKCARYNRPDSREDIPTAYDADKVVERIEQLRMQYFMTIANTGDKTLDVAYEKVCKALDNAIEIVKKGGKK